MSRLPLVLTALALAACSSGVPVSRQVVVPGNNFAAVQGESRFVVRTYLTAVGGEEREVTGAECDLVSSLYKATVVTPSEVVVPNFGPQSPELTVSCRANDLRGGGRVRISTRWQQPPGYWRDPYFDPWGPGWSRGGWPGWYGPSYPVSDYPNLNVPLYPAARLGADDSSAALAGRR